MSQSDLQIKLKQDFYKLHYPDPKRQKNRTQRKVRSKSVVSVLQSSISEETPKNQYIKPKGSIKKTIANRSQIYQGHWSPERKLKKTFRQILSAQQGQIFNKKDDINCLPINNMKDIEQISKRNPNVKRILQKSRDQKLKMNRIVMSHKQNQQIKLEYLRNKKQQIQIATKMEIKAIYDEFFRKQYEAIYGLQALQKFQLNMAGLITLLSQKIYMR